MRAIVVDPDAPGRLTFREIESPSPRPSEALVHASAFSLNLGEVRMALLRAEAGWRPGWELSGVVKQAAADGSGPSVGTRVFGMVNSGAWAQYIAVSTAQIAEIPDGVTFAQAATLPVAGLTATSGLEKGSLLLKRKLLVTGGPEMLGHIYGLEKGSTLLKQKVLVTGASGGVGHFACQLALQAGAQVVALVRRAERADSVRAVGVHEVVIGEDVAQAGSFGPYHLIVDTLGGKSLQAALTLLETNGVCVNLGAAQNPDATVQGRFASPENGRGSLMSDIEPKTNVTKDLEQLAKLVAEDRLHPYIGLEAPWTDIAEVAQSLLDRRIAGKAILRVS